MILQEETPKEAKEAAVGGAQAEDDSQNASDCEAQINAVEGTPEPSGQTADAARVQPEEAAEAEDDSEIEVEFVNIPIRPAAAVTVEEDTEASGS